MAGRGRKKQSKKIIIDKKWFAGIYGRRSFDDGDDNESYTITNQKALIESFLESKTDITITDYYIDDGYTGTNFERPGFKRLINDIKNGRINCIIIKDLSRLGRNHKEVGKYIEEIFPIYDVRVISINDNIDSYLNPESIKSLIISIKNLINENYSRDISKKVFSAYETMAKNGLFIAGTPPYGYKLMKDNKHKLEPDLEEAKIIKIIFDMAYNNNGRIKICKYLNDNGILCRKELQRRKKANLSLNPKEVSSKYFWNPTTIGRILKNEVYIGNLVQLKTTKAGFGSQKIITKDENECIKCENTQEPIISKEIFYEVQKKIRCNDTGKKSYNPSSYSKYRGILKCADCGKAMTRQEDFRGNRNVSNYYCTSHLRASKSCTKHKIKTIDLENCVLNAIQIQVKLVIELEKSLKRLYFKNSQNFIENEYKNKVRTIEMKIENLKERKRISYENWKFNKINKNDFINESKQIEDEIHQFNDEIELYTSSYKETVRKIRKNDYWIGHYKRNRRIKSVSKDILEEIVDKIYVFEGGNIEIKFKYQDEYESLLNYLEEEGVKEVEKMVIRNVSKTFI